MATAARVFEKELWPLVRQREAATEYQDPHPGKVRLTAAAGAMQGEFRTAFEALEDLHGEDLVRPITAETADVSVPTPAAATDEAFPRERGHGSLPT